MIDADPDFLAFLKEEEARAEDAETDERRAVAIDFYNGEPFGDEQEGRSQLVTRDVAEVVDYMTVSLLRTILSGDRVVEFEGRTPDQDQYSDDATETIQQQFMRRQKGYNLVHDWIKAGLVEITGIVKTYAEPQPPKRELLENVSAIALPMLEGQGLKVIEAEETGELDGEGAPLFNLALLAPQPPTFCDHAVPNEEFRCAPDARDLDSAIYLAHVPPKTVSDLAKMGFDADDLSALQTGPELNGTARLARDGKVDSTVDRGGANRRVAFREEYVLYDLNGDGVAERLMVQRVGDQLLAIEEVDEHPFEEWCPFPMPHRRIGQSLAEKVMDIQRVRSVTLRQTMDGFYFSNAPRTYVSEDALADSTIDDLLTVRPGQIVRYRGGIPPQDTQTRFDVSAGLGLLEQLVGERESRTGITRLNQGLDADALNKTATGTALMQAQGQQIEEYLARNFAEALGRLFAKKLRIMKRHGGAQRLRVDGRFREVDPAAWDEEMDLAIRVGLGSGRKDQRLSNRMTLLEIQKACLDAGLRIVGEEHIYKSIKGVVADAGLGNVNDFAADPSQLGPPPAPGPSPEETKVQAELALKQAALAGRQQESAIKIQLQQQMSEAKAALERFKAEQAAELERARAGFEARLAEQKLAFEQQLAREKVSLEREFRGYRAGGSEMSEDREGGDLSK